MAVNRSRVDAQVEAGDPVARRIQGRLRDLSFELSGAQLGITATSLILGAIAEPTVARLVEPAFLAVGIDSPGVHLGTALVLATVFQMVLGELFPKNVAIARPLSMSRRVALPMSVVNRLLRPLIQFFNRSANWTVRRLGIEPREELAGLRSLQELEMIVRASSAEGELDERETSILTRAISFMEKHAADVMIPRVAVIGLPEESSVAELRDLARETGHSRFPIYQGDLDQVTGIAYVKDTFTVPPESRSTVPVSAIATPATVVPDSMRLDTLLLQLQNTRRTIAIVVDEYGGTAGVVTVEDIVEEILGEIHDEYDEAEVPTSEDDGLVAGSLHRHEVEELTGFAWPEGGYETLNGYVTAQLDRFPRPGDVVVDAGYLVEVVEVEDHVATRLRVQAQDEPEP